MGSPILIGRCGAVVDSRRSMGWRPLSACEAALALAVTGLAFALRIWLVSTVGLEHFDEGVYALSGLGLSGGNGGDRLFPGQERFSPLVYPLLVAASFRLFGPADVAAVLPNVIAGTLSVLLLWWVGRRWFGPVAGLTAAMLLATSELHIALSRSALTDVSFLLLFLAALACAAEAVGRDSMAWAAVAGLMTGLAWNTKYHGWFVLVVTGASLAILVVQTGGQGWRRLTAVWALSAALACALYIPWVLHVQSQSGGYAGLISYQRNLVDGQWLDHFMKHARQLRYMDGVAGRAGFSVALLLALAWMGVRRLPRSACGWLLVSLIGLLLLGVVGAATALTLFWITAWIRQRAPYPHVVLICWLFVWLIVGPLYLPYLRLALPFAVAVFLGAGAFLQRSIALDRAVNSRLACPRALAAGAIVLLGGLATLSGLRNPANPWRPATDMREASRSMAAVIPEESTVVVIGHPEVAFYLRLAGRRARSPEPEPEGWKNGNGSVYLVEGVYARRAAKLRDGLQAIRGQLDLLATYPVVPKDLRVLDDFDARKARAYIAEPDGTFDLILYAWCSDPPSSAQAARRLPLPHDSREPGPTCRKDPWLIPAS